MASSTPLLHPAYFGSITLWSVILKAPQILFESRDNYQKQTYRNRMYIAHSNGKLGLNIPVKHAKDGQRQKTSAVQIENNFRWQRDHWRSLEAGYRSSPFFEYYEDELSPFFKNTQKGLFDHNIASMQAVAALLEISLDYSLTTTYQPEITDKSIADRRSLVRCKKTKVVTMPTYHQVHETNHGFLPDLSVLDLIFNLGPESLGYLESISVEI